MAEFAPTGRLRWARRTIRPNAAVDHEHTLEVLQQEWAGIDLNKSEWRDVPTEDER